jgi:hypothetical protein
MANASTRGRPRGLSEPTMAKARDILARHEARVDGVSATESVETIAIQEGVTPTTVWSWISAGRGKPTAVEPGSSALSPSPAKPRPRMTQRSLLHRAWIASDRIRVFKQLDCSSRVFWLNAVLEIAELSDDGTSLSFGQFGDAYQSREEFVRAAGRTEADLDDLVRRGLFLEAEGGIALPYRFGLRPREPIAGSVAFAPSLDGPVPVSRPGKSPDPRQGNLPPMGLPSTQATADSSFIRTSDSSNNRSDSSENGQDSGRNPDSDSSNNRLAGGEKGTTTTTTTQEESLLGGGGLVTAGGGEAANLAGVDSSNNPSETPADPPWLTLAAELVSLVGRPSQPTPAEIEHVRGWLTDGATPDLIRDAVRSRMKREKAPTMPALGYFNDRVREFIAAANAPRPVPTAVAARTPDAPEKAIDFDHEAAGDAPVNGWLDAWANVRRRLQEEAGEAEFRNWLRPMLLHGMEGDELVISLPSGFVRDWVRDRHGGRVAALWQAEHPEVRRVDFRVRPETR